MARRVHGVGVSPGVVAGPVACMASPTELPDRTSPQNIDAAAEADAAHAALDAVATELETRAASASGAAADVLAAQAQITRDPALATAVRERAQAGSSAVAAVTDAFAEFRALLARAGEYLAGRVVDLDDLRDRVVAVLTGGSMPRVPDPGHPFVLVADDLAPADTANLDTRHVLAIVTAGGGPTAHTAIIARSLGIPAVVGCADAVGLVDGDQVLVDGGPGTVEIAPSQERVRAALDAAWTHQAELAAIRGPGRTADGTPVRLLLNIDGQQDVEQVAAVDAEGVGLFRTEVLFLDRTDAPSEQEQQAVYRRVFDAFAGRRVVVRTLDAGADKPLRFVTASGEPNPALGVRGLRTARRHPELLDAQLAAIAAAARGSEAEVWVMAPMVATSAEAREFVDRAHAHGLDRAGVMIEVPAAALRAAHLAGSCDFVSLGTNDLAQYTYAADRMDGALADLVDPWQPATLELVRMAARAAVDAGRPVGVCGEAAGDPMLAAVLVGLGVNSLSMAASSVPEVRAALARRTLAECGALADLALDAPDGPSARAAVRRAVER